MRVAELSRTSGVPVPSIKYYLRAGLLPPGERTAPNQADYGEAHVHRLRLIRALIEVGGLPVASVKDVLAAMDAESGNLHLALGSAFAATLPVQAPEASRYTETARRTAAELIERYGWQVRPDSEKLETLVAAMEVLYRLNRGDVDGIIEDYARHADELGTREVAWIADRGDTDAVVEAAVVGTFIGGAVFNAMRVLVHESVSQRTLDPSAAELQVLLPQLRQRFAHRLRIDPVVEVTGANEHRLEPVIGHQMAKGPGELGGEVLLVQAQGLVLDLDLPPIQALASNPQQASLGERPHVEGVHLRLVFPPTAVPMWTTVFHRVVIGVGGLTVRGGPRLQHRRAGQLTEPRQLTGEPLRRIVAVTSGAERYGQSAEVRDHLRPNVAVGGCHRDSGVGHQLGESTHQSTLRFRS